MISGTALHDRAGVGHHLAVRNAWSRRQFGQSLAGFTGVVFDEIEGELERIVEQVLRCATCFLRQSGQVALATRGEWWL